LSYIVIKFGGSRATNDGDRRASLYVGWEDFATFSQMHKIGITGSAL